MQSKANRRNALANYSSIRNGFWHKWIFQEFKWIWSKIQTTSTFSHFAFKQIHLHSCKMDANCWLVFGNRIVVRLFTILLIKPFDVCAAFFLLQLSFFTCTWMNEPTLLIKSILILDMKKTQKIKSTILTDYE